ncbi:MAG: XdhC family protein [Eubacteriales bacterium]|nr:XdhC family protein [Eubacteriales bacterium]
MRTLFTSIKDAIERGERAVLCSVLASHGSTPRGQGARMAVFEDGSTMGTVGGGAIEHRATLLAKEVLQTGRSAVKSFALHKDEIADIGMVCGGDVLICLQVWDEVGIVNDILSALDGNSDSFLVTTVENEQVVDFCVSTNPPAPIAGKVYVESLKVAGRVYVFGGGHVSRALVPILTTAHFSVVVLEDREQFATKALFPTADDVLLVDFASLDSITLTKRDWAVIMTRGHQSDFDVLRQVLATPATYIGCIGSRSKVAHTQERLGELGFTATDFARVHSPIGLPIGGETPEEISIAIAAEMIAHRSKTK